MTDRELQHDGPAAVGRELAELADRLRLSVGQGLCPASPAWPSRFAAAAACWRCAAAEAEEGGWSVLAEGLSRLAGALAAGPEIDPPLRARLAACDATLESLLALVDAAGFAAAAADPAWRSLLPGRASVPGAGPAAQPESGPVVLLVASPFLRDMLSSRLAATGRRLVVAQTVADVSALLAGPDAPGLVLCDNEAPSNHLRRLRAALAAGRQPGPALVLVASAAEPAAGRERRARAAGADAVWPEPWRPEHLAGIAGGGGIS